MLQAEKNYLREVAAINNICQSKQSTSGETKMEKHCDWIQMRLRWRFGSTWRGMGNASCQRRIIDVGEMQKHSMQEKGMMHHYSSSSGSYHGWNVQGWVSELAGQCAPLSSTPILVRCLNTAPLSERVSQSRKGSLWRLLSEPPILVKGRRVSIDTVRSPQTRLVFVKVASKVIASL